MKGLDRAKIADLIGRAGQLPASIRADDPVVAGFLQEVDQAFPEDRRSAWTLACAMVAASDRQNRGAAFWSAGMVVIGAHRKTRLHQPAKRHCDALSSLIADFLGNHPEAAPLEIWKHFTDVVLMCSDVLADYNQAANILSYYPDADDPDHWEKIRYETFSRRVRRVRAELQADH
ncbi:MAG: hypothetical protein NT159_05815 [Proteobacteria bacterium]|nr:hypothetical protein [Pseudomonadota bacterium]